MLEVTHGIESLNITLILRAADHLGSEHPSLRTLASATMKYYTELRKPGK